MADEYSHEWHLFVCKVKAKERLIAKHNSDLEKLFDSCKHEQTEHKNSYVYGTKINRSSTATYDKCVLCGKCINWKTIFGEYA